MPNAIFSYEEVLRAIGRPALEESDTDEEKEGTRQSLGEVPRVCSCVGLPGLGQ